ncbi:MAG: class II fructose-bisphosphate aldolase, partial [Eubacterium sp.]|nr:class II fructose-bisphosphate aldolase [Eubacterium sp.]
FRNCIKGGICKVNIYTDINLAAAHAVAAYYNESRKMDRLIPEMVAAVKAATIEKMMIFGSQGKA